MRINAECACGIQRGVSHRLNDTEKSNSHVTNTRHISGKCWVSLHFSEKYRIWEKYFFCKSARLWYSPFNPTYGDPMRLFLHRTRCGCVKDPTGPGGELELPISIIKLHQTAPTGGCADIFGLYYIPKPFRGTRGLLKSASSVSSAKIRDSDN